MLEGHAGTDLMSAITYVHKSQAVQMGLEYNYAPSRHIFVILTMRLANVQRREAIQHFQVKSQCSNSQHFLIDALDAS